MKNPFLLFSFCWWMLVLYLGMDAACGFTGTPPSLVQRTSHSSSSSSSSSAPPSSILTRYNNAGEDFMEFFKNLWGGSNNQNSNNSNNQNNNKQNDSQEESAGTTLIASIPVQSIKPGGLRLFLMFYLMGMQNTPDKGTWKAHQPTTTTKSSSSEDYVVEMYFRDATAMLSIELGQQEIRILRCGSVPSTPYLMQESIMVQGILEELDRCAFDESVPIGNRLLTPEPSNAIELARGSLSFG